MVTDILLGIAKVDITPHQPIPLAGFGHRSGNSQGVKHSLYLKVWFFQQMEATGQFRKALLVQADIIAWNSERMEVINQHLVDCYGLPASSIILNASHTHCGPWTIDLLTPSNSEYVQFLEARLFEGIQEAYQKLAPVTMERGLAECRIGINRRKIINGEMTMAPNPQGPIDPEVSIIRFRCKLTNETKGVLFHYTCHPTTTDYNFISSEFPGIAMEHVEEVIGGGAIASFLQGCCGDIRPILIKEEAFYRGDDTDVRRLGKQLSDAVLQVLGQPMELINPSLIETKCMEVKLPFQNLPSDKQLKAGSLEPGIMGEWHRMLLANPKRNSPTIPFKMNFIKIAAGLAFLAMNGEMVVEYGLFLKRVFPVQRVLPLAYSNGMIGYVPTAAQLVEGGYEAKESIFYFGLPSPFTAEIENLIRDAAVQLLQPHI